MNSDFDFSPLPIQAFNNNYDTNGYLNANKMILFNTSSPAIWLSNFNTIHYLLPAN